MKIKALITTLVLGSSSLALAAPGRSRSPRPARRLSRRLMLGSYGQAATAGTGPRRGPMYPVTLASSQKVNGREVIRVAPSQRAFTKLELRSTAGRTKLDKVMITFANGGTQLVDCNKLLERAATRSRSTSTATRATSRASCSSATAAAARRSTSSRSERGSLRKHRTRRTHSFTRRA